MKRISNDTLLVLFGLALLFAFALGLILGAKMEARIQEQLTANRPTAVEVIR